MGAAEGSKRLVRDLINLWKIKKKANPALILKKLTDIYNVLEDVYSVDGIEELQSAIDQIGTGAGTIFIEAGTHIIDVPIDLDGCGSIVIYGHGDNTVLLPDDGITVFNITCCASLLIKTLRIDTTNYTGATQAVIINETNNNIVGFEDVSIGSIAAGFGICIELQSDNCYIDKCNLLNAQQGIFANNSSNHLITNNVIGLHAQYGIHLDIGDQNTISGNSLVSNTLHGIYVHDSDYVIISHNGCFSNLQSGIFFDQASYNTISACICNDNFQNGIYIGNQSNYNTISANNCNNNDSNTANPQGGIVIADDSDYNTISANSCNNNNNVGAGTGYGIIIHAATCLESMVSANNANGNDIDFQDSGTDTTIEYFVQDEFELQDAIDSISSKSGIINIEGSFAITATIGINNAALHGGSYIIRGDGSNTTLTPSGNFSCFNIREARSVIFENFKIDAANLVGTTPAIYILENSDNAIFVNNVEIVGDGTNGYGIQIDSPHCRIENCNITSMLNGIVPTDENCIITGNICNSNNNYGIFLNTANYITVSSNICNLNQIGIYLTSADGNLILGNTIKDNTADGIYLNTCDQNTIEGNIIDGNITTNAATDHAGITLNNGSLSNIIIGNTIINNVNGGAGEGYGVYIVNAACVGNIVRSNNISGNDINWKDIGTKTQITYYVSNEADFQDALDSIAAKSAIINIQDSFNITAAININGGGSYIIQGEGSNSTLTTGDNQCFLITSARSVLLQNFKIDASAITGRNTVIIKVDEVADNLVVIDNIEITGIVARGWGVEVVSNYVQIRNCRFSTIDMGINISGDYCETKSNILNGMDEYGIDCIGDYAIITNNTCSSSNNAGIQMNGGSYCNVSQNQCHSNVNYGIFVFSLDNMVLADNICTLNDAGIKIEDSNSVSVSNNTSSGNTTTGIMITGTSSNNIVIGNTCDNNAAGYGIIIGAAACVDNIVRNNNTSGNNWQVWDLGTNSDFEYRCSTEAEIQDALDSIAAKSGTIHILPVAGGIQLSATITVDGGGDYIIEGEGDASLLDCVADRTAISVTAATSCILRNFTVDAGDLTNNWRDAVQIAEASNNKVIIENVSVIGDAGKLGTGIQVTSDNAIVRNCYVYSMYYGIYLNSVSNCMVIGNRVVSNDQYGIQATACTGILISNNNTTGSVAGIYIYNGTTDSLIASNVCNAFVGIGIYIHTSHRNTITGNTCNTAGLTGYGINITGGDFNVCIGNTCHGSYEGFCLLSAEYNIIGSNIIGDTAIVLGVDTWGIEVRSDCIGNLIHDNILHDLVNTGAGDFIGIGITGATNVSNTLEHNIFNNCDVDIEDTGTTTIFHADNAVYGIGWNGDLGSATKNAIYDKIELIIAAGGAPNAFATITGITNDVIADNNADTLTLAAAGGLTIVGTAATDTITFTNTITQYTNAMAVAAVLAADDYVKNTSDIMTGTLTVQGLLTADGLVPEGDLADSLGTAALTWLNLYVQDIRDAAGNVILSNNGAGVIDVLANLSCNIVFTGAQTVDGKDVSTLCTAAEAVQAVEDAGLVLAAGKIIEFDGTPADGVYTGLVMNIDTTGCAVFDAVYVDGANSVAKAQATGIATMPAVGVVVAAGKVLTHGAIRSDASWAWAAGAVIYINETVAGELDDAIPALATELVQVMGVATEADTIFVNPSLDWVVRK